MSGDLFEEYPFSVPAAAVRPPDEPAGADRALAANVLGTLALTVGDRISLGVRDALGRGAHAPAALVVLLWYPDRPIGHLAARLRISHPGAVQLAQRLAADGLVERIPGEDGRTTLLALTPAGAKAALAMLAARREVLDRAVSALSDRRVRAFLDTASAMLEALTDDLLTGESMCRMCDELACPDERCPVERAEPAPAARRGLGYGVTASPWHGTQIGR